MSDMTDIIEGFQILMKHTGPDVPGHQMTSAEHDQLWCGGAAPNAYSLGDIKRLKELGFFWDDEVESWSKFT